MLLCALLYSGSDCFRSSLVDQSVPTLCTPRYARTHASTWLAVSSYDGEKGVSYEAMGMVASERWSIFVDKSLGQH